MSPTRLEAQPRLFIYSFSDIACYRITELCIFQFKNIGGFIDYWFGEHIYLTAYLYLKVYFGFRHLWNHNIYFTVTRIFPTVPIYILHWPFCNLRDVNMCTSQLYFQPRLAIVDIGLWDEICICWLYQRPNMPCFW